jgi:glycosyltransferase involved in cell wall biosynthesis
VLDVNYRERMTLFSRSTEVESYESVNPADLYEVGREQFGDPPRSVLFVAGRHVGHPQAGGSELLIDRLATGLSERGHVVSLLCAGPADTHRLYTVTCSGGTYTQYLRAPFKYLRSFRSTDLVVEVCNGMPFLVPLWRRGPSLCLVNHVHTQQWDQFFNPLVALFGRTMESDVMPRVHRHNLIATVSPSTREALSEIGVAKERIREIPEGVTPPATLYPKSETPLFVALGRLVGYKRVDLLLHIWNSVRPFTGGKLVIVGNGTERRRLEKLAGGDVEFVGHIDEEEKHRLLCQAWVLLHPAAWEGWGLVISEAGVRSTPAVGFDVRGVRDAIADGETGLLATDADQFARHWLTLARNRPLRIAMGEAARKRTSANPWELTVDAFTKVADEAVLRHEYGRRRVGAQESSRLSGVD